MIDVFEQISTAYKIIYRDSLIINERAKRS
jgi:hypothetical protein